MDDADRDVQLARTVLKQGELKLNAQLCVAIASDQRSGTFATLFGALAAAGFGGAAALSAASHESSALIVGAIAFSLSALVGAWLALWAALPQDFYVVGNYPKNWWNDGVDSKPLADCLRQESLNYQRKLEHNAQKLEVAAKRLSLAMWTGVSSPILALAAWSLASH